MAVAERPVVRLAARRLTDRAASLRPDAATRAVLLLALSFLAMSGLIDVSVLHVGHQHGDLLTLLVLVAAFVVAEAALVHLEIGANAYTVSVSEAVLAVGLLTGTVTQVVAARLLGGMIALVVPRRQRAVKMAFNMCSWSMEVTVAVLVFGWMHGSSATVASAWPAVTVAVLTAGVWQTAAVCVAISVHAGRLSMRTVRGLLLPTLASTLAGSTVAIVAVGALAWDAWALLPIGVCALVLTAAYRGYARLRSRNTVLQMLYDATRKLSRSSTSEEMLQDVLGAVRDMLRAEEVELLLDGPSGGAGYTHTLGEDSVLRSEPLPEGWQDWAHQQALASGEAVIMASGSKSPATRAYLADHGYTDCVLVPLPAESNISGTLRVANRLGDVATFGPEDAKLLHTIATQAAAALENTRLLHRLNHDSRHDPLTGLANRAHFQDRLRLTLAANLQSAVLLMDLDRFKEINDTLGHHHGDLLLIEVSKRLGSHLRDVDQLARLGGDEFAIQLAGASTPDALRAADRLNRALLEPITIDGISVNVQGSIGIAIAPLHGNSATELLRHADVAMYAAKRGHSGVAVYERNQDDSSPRRLQLASELREAILDGQLELHYQPQVQAPTGQVLGVEALVRWRHPEFGLVAPDEFLPLAEQTGQIRQLTRWVLKTAIAQISVWDAQGLRLDVSVNVSIRNLLELDLPDYIAQIVQDTALRPGALTVEVTESHIMADPDRTLGVLNRLHANGIRLSIDDFGTGYSSLGHLRLMPVQELKIDKSFVIGLAGGRHEDNADAGMNIIRTVLSLAQSLDLTVVAEGVETLEIAQLLTAAGCERLQGFHFSRPLPSEDVPAWVRTQNARPPFTQRPRLRPVNTRTG